MSTCIFSSYKSKSYLLAISQKMTRILQYFYHCKNLYIKSYGVNSSRMFSSVHNFIDESNYDPEQTHFMKTEKLLRVSFLDEPLTSITKHEAHSISPQLGLEHNGCCNTQFILHRAFSLFVFKWMQSKTSSPSEHSQICLLLTRRSPHKITFKGLLSNTCCSHPLYTEHELGRDDWNKSKTKKNWKNNCYFQGSSKDSWIAPPPNSQALQGIKNASIRKLKHELGITISSIPTFITRVHYGASDFLNPSWGEHEIDYILFAVEKANTELKMELNANEVSEAFWVTLPELQALMQLQPNSFTPWFQMIYRKFLQCWWKTLERKSTDSSSACVNVIPDFTTIYSDSSLFKN